MVLTVIEQVEQDLYDKGISISNTNLGTLKAVSIDGYKKSIFIDKNQIEDTKELRVILEHEKDHWDYPMSFYDFNTSSRAIKIRETKTNKRLIKRLIPCSIINKMISSRIPLHEMAEELCITEELLRYAYDLYKNLGELKGEII